MKVGQEIIEKLQAPSTKLQGNSKHQGPNKTPWSLAEHACEDQMKFFCFEVKGARFICEPRLSGGDQTQEVFRFFRLFNAATDCIPKIFLGNTLIRLAVVRANTRPAPNQLTHQSVISGTARNLLC